MNVEQRLQHAARELREVEITTPPLGERTPPPRRLQTLAVPMLFVVGGLVAISGVRDAAPPPIVPESGVLVVPADESDEPADPGSEPSPEVPGDVPADSPTVSSAPSVHAELEMIAEFLSANEPPGPVDQPVGEHEGDVDSRANSPIDSPANSPANSVTVVTVVGPI